MENICKNFEKCPIYSGILKDKAMTAAGYRKLYCEAGEQGWKMCKRYLVKDAAGKCPPDLLPNSFRTVEEIISEMQ